MHKFQRICIAKTSWSSNYQGAKIYGRFKYVQDTKDGSERFNFLPGPDGRYYVYAPPNRGKHIVHSQDEDWLILVVAPETKNQGRSFGPLRIVGWFEDATLVQPTKRPEYGVTSDFPEMNSGEAYTYTAVAKRAFLLPPDARTEGLPTAHGRKLGSANSIVVRGPNVDADLQWKKDYAAFAENFVKSRRSIVPTAAEIAENAVISGDLDIRGKYGWPSYEHRVRVEKAAEDLAKSHFKNEYLVEDVTDQNLGYDFRLTHLKDNTEILLEVKGTCSDREAFFLTRNEHLAMQDFDNFRLFLATSVLSTEPGIKLFSRADIDESFDLKPLSYRATKRE